VTEAEWLNCTDPQPMLENLRGKVSERKLRLFLIACCQACWHLCKNQISRQAVEMAEQYTEGRTNEMEIRDLSRAAWKVGAPVGGEVAFAYLAARTLDNELNRGWGYADDAELESIARHAGTLPGAAQCQLLHDIFGNPFHPVTIIPSWLGRQGGLLVSMAQKMYDSRDFADLPVLADALEEAGCTNSDILSHCRSGGEHVRGCWLVDLVLGKS
jgi:hypothetical protein